MARNLVKFVLVLVAMTAARVWAAGPEDDAINVRSFSIPIGISGQKDKIHEVELFVSSDEGKTWIRTSVMPPDKEGFTYTAPTDGTYWFKVCVIDKMGGRQPNDIYKSGDLKKILVDTLPPTLRIVKAERQGDRVQGEQILVSWEIQEQNPDLNTLKLEYKTSDGFWYPATIIPAMIGQGKFRPLNSGPVTVRMQVSDLAGNQSVPAEMEVAGHEEISANLTTTSMQVPANSNTGTATSPSPSFPPVAQQPVVTPPVAQPAYVNNSGAPIGGAAPVIPQGYGGNSPATVNSTGGISSGGMHGGTAVNYQVPPRTAAINSTLEKAPASLVMGPSGAANAPGNWQQNNGQQSMSAHRPDSGEYGANWSAPAPASGRAGGIGLPVGNPPGEVLSRWVNNTRTQITNTTQITLNYQIDRLGPSGVGSVDLYLTRDGGQRWQRYAEDTDREPPMVVDLPGEGLFGLRLVVTSRAGLGRRPPQSGDLPEMYVEVDMTPPVVKLYRPEPDPRKRDAIILTWEASDHELAATPITLQWAERPDGVWNTIATGLTNSQRYVWTVPPNLVQVYLRVVARDAAGNQGYDETADPILVDLHEPEGKILGISTGVRRQ
jgi:hypothetical protein